MWLVSAQSLKVSIPGTSSVNMLLFFKSSEEDR